MLEELPEDYVLHSVVAPQTLALVIRLLYLQSVSWELRVVLPEFLLPSKVTQSILKYLDDHLTNFLECPKSVMLSRIHRVVGTVRSFIL